MATKPTAPYDTPPTWATNATYALGDEVGEDTKIAPPTAQVEDGWRPGQRPPPQYDNFIMHSTGLWLTWAEDSIDEIEARIDDDEWVYPTAKERQVTTMPTPGMGSSAGASTTPPFYVDGTTGAAGGMLVSQLNSCFLRMPLAPFYAGGNTITEIQVFVKPGAARGVHSSVIGDNGRMWMSISGVNVVGHTHVLSRVDDPAVAVEDDGTTDLQVLTLTGLSQLKSIGGEASLWVNCGNTAGSAADRIGLVAIFFDDPGPRND